MNRIRKFLLVSSVFCVLSSTLCFADLVYQDFNPGNGTEGDYGWSINGAGVGVSTEQVRSGSSQSWKMTISQGIVAGIWEGTGIKSQSYTWHMNFEIDRLDRLTFWIWADPVKNASNSVAVKFFDHNKYVYDPDNGKDGFTVWTTKTAQVQEWTKLTVLFTQLPSDFNLYDVDKIEFYNWWPGLYYFDDIQIISADRVYQAFESWSCSSAEDCAWAWDGTVEIETDIVHEGEQSLKFTTAENKNWAGVGMMSQEKRCDSIDSCNNQDSWHVDLSAYHLNPKQYDRLTFWVYSLAENGLSNNFGVQFFDYNSPNYYENPAVIWTQKKAVYGKWTKLTVLFEELPEDLNLTDINKIQIQTYWPGLYYFDDIRVTKPVLYIDKTVITDGVVNWTSFNGAGRYTLQKSTNGENGPWHTVYTGPDNSYTLERLSQAWLRVSWKSPISQNNEELSYQSDWSDVVHYLPKPVLINYTSLKSGNIEWTNLNQTLATGEYEVECADSKKGPWSQIYKGPHTTLLSRAVNGKWYRIRAVREAAGVITDSTEWGPSITYDPEGYVRAVGTVLKERNGDIVALRGVNLGNYFLLEPWMLLGSRNDPVEKSAFGGDPLVVMLLDKEIIKEKDNDLDYVYFSDTIVDQYELKETLETIPLNPEDIVIVENLWKASHYLADDWTIRNVLTSRFGVENTENLIDIYQQAYIQEADFDNITRMGMNVVRLPIYYKNIRDLDDSGDWVGSDFNLDKIDRIVNYCADRGIYVLLDLHGAPGGQSKGIHTGRGGQNKLFAEDNTYRVRTKELWEVIARHYKDNPIVVGYDLLNEPIGAPSKEDLWDIYDTLYKAIRKIDRNHLIVMEGIWDWDTLPIPESKGWNNILYQFHYYLWGKDVDVAAHEQFIDEKISNNRQEIYNVPVMIGEFSGFGDKRIWKYYLDKFDEQGWSWMMWSYKGHDSNSEWGLYNHFYYDENIPDFENDNLLDLERKLVKYDTLRYHDSNDSLIKIIGRYLDGFLSQGLVTYYSFDQDDGDIVFDESGFGNTGDIIGTPSFIENGVIGGALDFKKNDYIKADTNPLSGAENFSVSLWFKTIDPTKNYKLASAAYWYGGSNASGWIIGTHYPEAWGDDQSGTFRGEPGWERTVQFVPREWNHHVVTYDGERVKEYINGQLANEVIGTGVTIGSGRPMEVAAWSQYSGMNYEGLIDEFRVYNRALSYEEVQYLAEAPGKFDNTPPSTPVVSDEGEFTNQIDQLYVSWTSEDAESGIVDSKYKITQDSPTGTIVRNWTSTGDNTSVTAGALSLIETKTYYFSVITRNGAGLLSEEGYSDGITVKVNHTPVIVSFPIKTAIAGQLYQYDVNATDVDGDTLTYKLIQSPKGMTIDADTGLISWTPGKIKAGRFTVRLQVKDSQGAFVGQVYVLKVISQDKIPPVLRITSPASNSVVSNFGFEFTGTAVDPSGVNEVRVSVYDYGRGTYTVSNVPATYESSSNIWRFNVLSSHITAGAKVKLLVRAQDTAGNWTKWLERVVVSKGNKWSRK